MLGWRSAEVAERRKHFQGLGINLGNAHFPSLSIVSLDFLKTRKYTEPNRENNSYFRAWTTSRSLRRTFTRSGDVGNLKNRFGPRFKAPRFTLPMRLGHPDTTHFHMTLNTGLFSFRTQREAAAGIMFRLENRDKNFRKNTSTFPPHAVCLRRAPQETIRSVIRKYKFFFSFFLWRLAGQLRYGALPPPTGLEYGH